LIDTHAHLYHRFRQQQQSGLSYSPLYTSLFGAIADWLSEEPAGAVATWLVGAFLEQSAFDVTLLLAAAIHRDVLVGNPAADSLRPFYPSVGGSKRAGEMVGDSWRIESRFRDALESVLLTRGTYLGAFVQANTVQTNETGRGLAWLLPAAAAGMGEVTLVDLGASAGLNLVAERRRYTLVDAGDGRILVDLGQGRRTDITVRVDGWSAELALQKWTCPDVRARIGGDIHPFPLESRDHEQTLAAFIWADQVERLQRLRSGIGVFREVEGTETAVQLHKLILPDGLPCFLERTVRPGSVPLICYNTYIKMYLRDKGAALSEHISAWAVDQERPIVWIQWEPPSCVQVDLGPAPDDDWLVWTIDLWHRGQHHQWFLGWTHPHGQKIQVREGFTAWMETWHDLL